MLRELMSDICSLGIVLFMILLALSIQKQRTKWGDEVVVRRRVRRKARKLTAEAQRKATARSQHPSFEPLSMPQVFVVFQDGMRMDWRHWMSLSMQTTQAMQDMHGRIVQWPRDLYRATDRDI